MNIADLTMALQKYVTESQQELEEILREHVGDYLSATLNDPDWFAAILHMTGSEADEALRLSRVLENTPKRDLSTEVTHRLASGIISTTLMPAVLPSSLISSMNQAILSCLRDDDE